MGSKVARRYAQRRATISQKEADMRMLIDKFIEEGFTSIASVVHAKLLDSDMEELGVKQSGWAVRKNQCRTTDRCDVVKLPVDHTHPIFLHHAVMRRNGERWFEHGLHQHHRR